MIQVSRLKVGSVEFRVLGPQEPRHICQRPGARAVRTATARSEARCCRFIGVDTRHCSRENLLNREFLPGCLRQLCVCLQAPLVDWLN